MEIKELKSLFYIFLQCPNMEISMNKIYLVYGYY
jgi:hypothetical protein